MEGVVRSAACGRVESVVRVAACGRARGVVREGTGQLGEAQLVTLRGGVQALRLPGILPTPQHLRENRQIDRSSPQFYPANQDLPRGQEKYPSDVTSCC